MFTGYFAKLKTYEQNGLIPVAICEKPQVGIMAFGTKNSLQNGHFLMNGKTGLNIKVIIAIIFSTSMMKC